MRLTLLGSLAGLITMASVAWADSTSAPAYEWESVTLKAPWAARDGAGILSYQGRLWLLGGWNPIPADRQFFPLICNNEVWSSPNGADWTLVKPNTFKDRSFDPESDWEGRHTAGYAVFRDRMWIIGGDCNQKHYQNDIWSSTDGEHWTHVNRGKDVPWAPRALHYTVTHDNKLWVIGGQTMPGFGGGEEAFYQDLWTSTDGVEWKQILPKEPCWSARTHRWKCSHEWSNLDPGWRNLRYARNSHTQVS